MELIDAVSAALGELACVRRLVVVERCGSTNDELRRLAREGAPAGTVVVADEQLRGRGRMGRAWHSPPGVGLYLSLLLRPPERTRHATRWTLAAALAACESCRALGASDVRIDWPNDVVHGGLKLGGVLAELRSDHPRGAELVLGLGLNVAHAAADFPDEIRGRATSLAAAGGRPSRAALARDYLERLAGLAAALERGAWDAVAERWTACAPDTVGRRVAVRTHEGLVHGTTEGIDDAGALLVREASGELRRVMLADSVSALEEESRCS